jgi:hypothetical protein
MATLNTALAVTTDSTSATVRPVKPGVPPMRCLLAEEFRDEKNQNSPAKTSSEEEIKDRVSDGRDHRLYH